MRQVTQMKQRLLGASSKVKIVAVIGILLVGAMAYYNYQSKNAVKGQRPNDSRPVVDVMTIQRKDMTKKIELTGQTVPEYQVDIATKYAGRIANVSIELGQQVIPGQILLIQDTSDVDISLALNDASLRQADADAIESNSTFQASYQKAQADYRFSVTTWQRYQTLYSQGAISKELLDTTEQKMVAAKATLDTWANQMVAGSAAAVESKRAVRDKAQHGIEALQKQREDLILRAPRAGVIGFRQAEVGAMAQAGQKVLSIVDNSNIFVDCLVSEQDIGQISLEMPTQIAIESLGKSFAGKIIYISPAMDTKTQMFTIRVALDNPDAFIKAGMFARTDISVLLRAQTLMVPKEAIVSLNGTNRIFVVDENNKIVERSVTLGLRNDKGVEILTGVNEGEKVAITNLARLKTGIAITPNPM